MILSTPEVGDPMFVDGDHVGDIAEINGHGLIKVKLDGRQVTPLLQLRIDVSIDWLCVGDIWFVKLQDLIETPDASGWQVSRRAA